MGDVKEEREEKLTVDEIIPYVGEFGRYQKILDAMVFMIFWPVGLQPYLMYFSTLVPEWRCLNSTNCNFTGTLPSDDNRRCYLPENSWEYIEKKEFSLVTQFDLHCDQKWILHLVSSMFFVGQGFGSVTTGWLADKHGRKRYLFPAIVMVLLAGFVTPFMPNIYGITVCRFIVGFFYPGVCGQSFVLLSELVGTKKRPAATLIPYLSMPPAWALLSFQAYMLKDWKMLSICCTAPYVLILTFYPFFPESVRWLQMRNRQEDAMAVFRKIARWNKKELPKHITLAPPKVITTSKSSGTVLDLVRSWKVALRTFALTYMWTFISLALFGLQLSANNLEGSIYRDFVLLGSVEIPATFLTIFCCNKFGRKKTAVPPLLISGVALLSIAFIPEKGKLKIARTALGIFGRLCTATAYKGLYVWSSEIFPTDIRAVGMGILQVGSRVGSSSSPWVANGLKQFGDFVPYLVMGITSLVGSFMGFTLPETKNKQLKDTQDENENDIGMAEMKKNAAEIECVNHDESGKDNDAVENEEETKGDKAGNEEEVV